MTQLKLTRRGEFVLSLPLDGDDNWQCGPRGMRKFFYRVEITAPSTALDPLGFLIDQLEVHALICRETARQCAAVLPSCERLALMINALLRLAVPAATRVFTAVGGLPAGRTRPNDHPPAWIEAVWDAPTPVPEQPNAPPGNHPRPPRARRRTRNEAVPHAGSVT